MDYNKTVNLPQTDFPMRAGLPNREPTMLEGWNSLDLYHELLEKNKDFPRFSLHDGPPFSNGDLHMGHALNKSIKDFIIRSKAMNGFYTPYLPGWDNHGMPIESAIIKKNKLKHKEMSVSDFRTACHQFADDFIDRQRTSFRRLGVVGEWDTPYKTMNPSFEGEEVRIFGKMYEKGYIYKGLKPVYWCPNDETALAEAEIEYSDAPCTTVYVKFKVVNDQGKLGQYSNLSNTSVIIWTTTPWTLPGNLAIAVHPRESYALVSTDKGEFIIAEALIEKTMKEGGIEEFKTITTFPGKDLEMMETQHPFLDRKSVVVNADYVTMDSGTGCVHTAPGFGADDYQTCLKYGIDLIVPVDDRGIQTADAGKFAGMYYEKSNGAIIEDLEQTGALFAKEDIVHSYPHCWRCKNPIIFRATPQWFCSVESFKEDAVRACEEVRWLPSWGKERMTSMIRERNDWCISRQRRWGLPIPVFYCEDCNKPVCTPETIESVATLFSEKGSNIWYDGEVSDLIPAGTTCPHCGGTHLYKEEDTLDCWFDSGSTHMASMELTQGFWPADLYLEGADQYRGWFQSSLLTSIAARDDKKAPYKECLTHGWTVDGEGRAMHKSLGNGVDPATIVKQYGADLIRLWAGSADYRVDVRCSDAIFKQLSQTYLKFRNTARYCLGNLDGFDPNQLTNPEEMDVLDLWALSRLNVLIEKCEKAYNDYEFHVISHSINDFCVVELSSFYLDIIKDRLYCEEKDGNLRRSAQTALYLILDTLTKLFAPILAFTCDEIWLAMPHEDGDDPRNVLLNQRNAPFPEYALSAEQAEQFANLINLRSDVNQVLETARKEKTIGKALEAQVTLITTDEKTASMLNSLKSFPLHDYFIVSKVTIVTDSTEDKQSGVAGVNFPALFISASPAEDEKCERCWKHDSAVGSDTTHPTLCPRCVAVVSS
ncbi:MAG: isoleucine--tRNA ligase [Eubacteriales bacterium]